jgi:DNA-binding MurR/RpiR family transcriptional regulator
MSMGNTSGTASFDDLRARIAAARGSMPKRLAQAAGFALAHPDDVAFGTAASIAKAAEVQPSTLVRLAHRLGYDGFSELQSVFRAQLKRRASSYGERLDALERGNPLNGEKPTVLHGFLDAARRSIETLSQTIDEDHFQSGVELLAPAFTIYLVARRRAYPLSAHMSYSFSMLGIRSVVVNSPNEIGQELVAMATPDDAAVVCSFAPYSTETLALIGQLAENGVPTLAVTDSALSPLATMATKWIEVPDIGFSGFRTLAAAMTVAVALPVAVAECRRHPK